MPEATLSGPRRALGASLIALLIGTYVFLGGFVDLASAGMLRVEKRLFRCTNSARKAHGLRPLKRGRALHSAARYHAHNMRDEDFFDHTDPEGRGPWERVHLFHPDLKYTGIAENIAAGFSSAKSTCQGFMDSPGHRENVLGPYGYLGVGFARGGRWHTYFVEDFGRL